jgi:hypothetical protein
MVMSYEFLADRAIMPGDEGVIDNVVEGRERYTGATLTAKAQILSTGLCHEDTFVNCIKNGRERNNRGVTTIGGYPALIQRQGRILIPQEWISLFEPAEGIIGRLPPWSALITLEVRLTRPFFSREDVSFYPTENPLKKEWIFGVPYLSAAGVKGLLRWAWRMQWEDDQDEKDIEEGIFGPRNEEMQDDNARHGSLWTYPLIWNGDIGLDVINPYDRIKSIGIKPIKYEVVKSGATAKIHLIILNRDSEKVWLLKILDKLRPVLDLLLQHGGISAKRSADWGTVDVIKTEAFIRIVPGEIKVETDNVQDIWSQFLDSDGGLKSLDDEIFTTNVLSDLSGISRTQIKKDRQKAKEMIKTKWEESRKKTEAGDSAPEPIKRFKETNTDALIKKIRDILETNPS